MDSFDKALEHTLGNEGDYSDEPADRGGATRYGITEATARANGYTGEMRELPLAFAKGVYRRSYWERLRLDDVAAWDEPAALELFDSAVNCGPETVARWLQRALNALNRNQGLYPDITEDGRVGPQTLGCLAFLTGPADRAVLRKMLDCQQGAHYLELMRRDPTQRTFARGWFAKRIGTPS